MTRYVGLNMREEAEKIGLKNFDTALPQGWVNSMIEQRKIMKEKGFLDVKSEDWPWGFVWCYDYSSIFGEPVPVTPEARVYAKEMSIAPRAFKENRINV